MRRLAQLVPDRWRLDRAVRGVTASGFYGRRLSPGDLCFDIGAHAGEHTRGMLRAGARVVAVEPQPDLAQQLLAEFPSVRVVQAGVSDRRGRAVMRTASDNTELATLHPDWDPEYAQWDGRLDVEVTTLDALIAEHGVPAFIKIDTEGLEDRVLAGLSGPVEQVLVEYHSDLREVAMRAVERLEVLGTYRYHLLGGREWIVGPAMAADEALASLADWGDIWACAEGR